MKDKDQDKGWWTRKKNEYRQQVSWVWKPKYTVETMSLPFLLIGTGYFLLGIFLCLYQQNTREEFVWDYTSCTQSDHKNNTEQVCCNSSLNLQGMDDSRDLLIYYQLENFFQNHRLIVGNRDDVQLSGRSLDTAIAGSDCEDPNNNIAGIPIVPCGALANSMFDDKLLQIKDCSNGVDLINNYFVANTSIATRFDLGRFANKNGSETYYEGIAAKPTNWSKHIWEIEGGLENKDFVVWMRSSPKSTFRKLWKRIAANGLSFQGNYTICIENNYDVSYFNGRKKIIVSQVNMFGNKDKVMGRLAFLTSFLFSLFGIFFLVLSRWEKRDMSTGKH